MTANSLSLQEDEIELTALLSKLWEGRKVVALTTLTGLTAAFTYVMNAPQVWISSATIAPPSYEQMGDYYLIKTQLDATPLFSKKESNVKKVNVAAVGSSESNEDQALSEQLFDAAQLILETTQGLVVLRPDGRKQLLFQVQAGGDSPEKAQKNLAQSLSKANLRLAQSKTRELRIQMVLLQRSLLNERQALARQAQAKKTQELAITRQSLDSAKRAGVVQFSGSSYAGLEQPEMRYLLGSKHLQGKLVSLEQAPPEYPARYYEISTQLAEIQKLPPVEAGNLAGFQLVTSPTLPDQPDKPKKMLIIGLGMAGGLLLGSLWTLRQATSTKLQTKDQA